MQHLRLLIAVVVASVACDAVAQVAPPPTAPTPAPASQAAPAPVPAPAPAPAQPPAPAKAPAQDFVASTPAATRPQPPPPFPRPPVPPAGSVASGDDDTNWSRFSDHDRIVGHMAVGFMGVLGVPYGMPDSQAQVDAPTVGIRYWLDPSVAIEIGLGLGFTVSGSESFAPGTTDIETGKTGEFGLVLHGGLPISAWDVGHYNAVIVPELNVGFSNGIIDTNPAIASDDVFFNGLLVHVGVRAGAEFHLEFLDMPQATLQLTLGVGLSLERRMTESDAQAGFDTTTLRIATNLNSLSDLAASGLQAFFYF